MIRNVKSNKGFTLIELMIVVAIIGILAAIAIPNFVAMQLRAKRSEMPSNVDGIRTAEKAYEHEWDAFTSCLAAPSSMPTKTQVDFGITYADSTADWVLLGWLADGKVRAQYQVSAFGDNTASEQNFSATAAADIDGENATSSYWADKNNKATMSSGNADY